MIKFDDEETTQMSKVRVYNEWDPLEEILVGRATNARIPCPDTGLFALEYREYGSIENIPSGRYNDRVIEETEEDLDELVQTFQRIGSRVPGFLPQRITPELVVVLRKYRVWLSLHFCHTRELTPEVAQACDRLADGGIPLGSQTVLLNCWFIITALSKFFYSSEFSTSFFKKQTGFLYL